MKILLTGATGLLGGALLGLLLEEGHEVRCLLRRNSPNASRLEPGVAEVVYGDANSEQDLLKALAGTEAMVHVAGIEYAPEVLGAMRRSQVGRLLVVSSTSVHSSHEFRSGPKRRMEELVRSSGLDWTITRPTMIYGSERDKNIHRLLRFLDRSPVFPIFGSGENLFQPVYYEDCASGVYEALTCPAAVGQTYDLPGSISLTYRHLVRTAAGALGKNPFIVPIPLEPVRRVLHLAERFRLPLPVKSEQVLRLREDKAYPYDKARRGLDYTPRPFDQGVSQEVARLREIGMLRA